MKREKVPPPIELAREVSRSRALAAPSRQRDDLDEGDAEVSSSSSPPWVAVADHSNEVRSSQVKLSFPTEMLQLLSSMIFVNIYIL